MANPKWMVKVSYSVSTAAALAFENGQPELGVELLDQGRAMVFSQLSRYQVTLDDLKNSTHPNARELAERFISLGQSLHATTVAASDSLPKGRSTTEAKVEQASR